jgi:tight adherence protein B
MIVILNNWNFTRQVFFLRKRFFWKERIARPSIIKQRLLSIRQTVELPLNRLVRIQPFQYLFTIWMDAGYGASSLTFFIILFTAIIAGWMISSLIGGRLILSLFLSFFTLSGSFGFLYTRARLKRQQFQNQFPAVLERLADCLVAGFSLPQAISFMVPNLAHPSDVEFKRIADQLKLGFTIDQALNDLYRRRPLEDVRMLVEGLVAQRQVGGDLPVVMRRIADLVRTRVEIELEIKTLTSQGRLSAVVIALLVPVSLFLLSFIPGYLEILFHTTPGNLVLIAVGMLEAIGAVIVFRQINFKDRE